MYFTKGFGFGRVSNERQTAFPAADAAENALPHRDRDRRRPSERARTQDDENPENLRGAAGSGFNISHGGGERGRPVGRSRRWREDCVAFKRRYLCSGILHSGRVDREV